MKPRPRILLRDDDSGVFPVVEAILVAVLVLTAIVFFTSVQRPTTGAEEGGIDLAQIAADTLQLMQSGEQDGLTMEEWVTALANGDDAGSIEDYLVGDDGDGILPKGSRYQLRLDNGVSSLPILPFGGAEAPRGARAAQVTLMPDWGMHATEPALWVLRPGEIIPGCDDRLALVNANAASPVDPACPAKTYSTFLCIEAPNGSLTLTDLGDADMDPDDWIDHWQAVPPVDGALTAPVLWKAKQSQVPADALYGVWVAYTDVGCAANPTYFRVVRTDESFRTGTATTLEGEDDLTASTVVFDPVTDVGKPITGVVLSTGDPAFPPGTTIAAVVSPSAVTLSQNADHPDASDVIITVGAWSPYAVYGLQLVVWFGA